MSSTENGRDSHINSNFNNSISQGGGDVKGEYSISENGYTDYDKPITVDDIRLLRKITKAHGGEHVSINDFTSEDIQKARKWAYKFYKDLELYHKGYGVKSPFFRAWFGDWRMYDTVSKIDYVDEKRRQKEISNKPRHWLEYQCVKASTQRNIKPPWLI